MRGSPVHPAGEPHRASLPGSLMVQYLYAAWSLGGPQVPEAARPRVARW